MSAFNSKERGEFVFAMGALNVGGAEGHHHAIGMPGGLLVNGIDEIERVTCEVALVGFRLDLDGEELGAEISGFRLLEADVAMVVGVGRSDVVALVEKTLRSVGMGVDDDGRVLNLIGLFADGLRVCLDRAGEGEDDGETTANHPNQDFHGRGFYTRRLFSCWTGHHASLLIVVSAQPALA
jgi:hypothetical protein